MPLEHPVENRMRLRGAINGVHDEHAHQSMVVVFVVNDLSGDTLLLMAQNPSLSLALRWLLAENGLSESELSQSAGVSPGTVTAFLSRPHSPTLTWLTILSAMRCRLELHMQARCLKISLPHIHQPKRARERQRWQERRLTAFRSQIVRQRSAASPREAQRLAMEYVAASETRLDGDLEAASQRLATASVRSTAPGMRAALRQIADAAILNAEDLALLAGVSLGSAQAVLGPADDGRLATPLRLFSALSARLTIIPTGGGSVTIALAAPGDWRPETQRLGRSSMSQGDIIMRARQGEPLSSIARAAGVSRQRIHAIVSRIS